MPCSRWPPEAGPVRPVGSSARLERLQGACKHVGLFRLPSPRQAGRAAATARCAAPRNQVGYVETIACVENASAVALRDAPNHGLVVVRGCSLLRAPLVYSVVGKLTSSLRPPPAWACAVMVASWASAMAWTIARPSPTPSVQARGCEASRSKGWNRRVSSPAGMRRPVLATERTACSASVRVAISIRPPVTLCRVAFERRLATSRSTRCGSPVVRAGSSVTTLSNPGVPWF
jgi:hypothetical protein